MKLWRAFRNMMAEAVRHPLWAISKILLAPILVIKPLFFTAVAAGMVGVVC